MSSEMMNYRVMVGTELLATVKVPKGLTTVEALERDDRAKFAAMTVLLARDIWKDETGTLYGDDGENPPVLIDAGWKDEK